MSQQHFLPPDKLRLRQRADGVLLLDLDCQTVALSPPKRALPLSEPDRFIVLSDEAGQEIGVVRDLAELEPHSRAVLQDALERAYVIERITRIIEVEKEALTGQTRWRVEIATDEQAAPQDQPEPSALLRPLNVLPFRPPSTQDDDKSNLLNKVQWFRQRARTDEQSADAPDENAADEEKTEENIVARLVTEEREFCISGQEDVQTARYPQIYIVDTEGHRYEIPNCEALDLASRRAAERFF